MAVNIGEHPVHLRQVGRQYRQRGSRWGRQPSRASNVFQKRFRKIESIHRDDSLTRLRVRQLVAAASGRDVTSGSRDPGPARCRSIHPAPRARVRNGRAPSRARGNQRAGTLTTGRQDPMIGNRAPSRHSGRTPGCGHGRLPRRDGRHARFERPRCPPGRTSAAIRATSG